MAIQSIPIRATISFGGLTVKTPWVLSFNVTKTRNSKSTFSASVKVLSSDLASMSDNKVVIYAGEKGREKLIFTGYILSTRPSICFDDPNYTIINISGSDVLYRLDNEKYTRRQINSNTRWAVIESVVRTAGKGGQFELINDPVQIVDPSPESAMESKNKSITAGAPNLGALNLPDGTRPVQFVYSPTKNTGEI